MKKETLLQKVIFLGKLVFPGIPGFKFVQHLIDLGDIIQSSFGLHVMLEKKQGQKVWLNHLYDGGNAIHGYVTGQIWFQVNFDLT